MTVYIFVYVSIYYGLRFELQAPDARQLLYFLLLYPSKPFAFIKEKYILI